MTKTESFLTLNSPSNSGTSSIKLTRGNSLISSNVQVGGELKRQRRRSEDDDGGEGVDFFLTQQELKLDVIEWEDIKNTRLGRKLNFQISKKDRDIMDLKEKVR